MLFKTDSVVQEATLQKPSDVEHQRINGSDADSIQLGVGGYGNTKRGLRNYQVTMIGFCSGIGTGLFIGTGSAYSRAGPAGLLLAYIVVGSVLWAVMQSIGELATLVSHHAIYRPSGHPSATSPSLTYRSSPQLDPFPIGRHDSSIHRLAFPWQSLTVTAMP